MKARKPALAAFAATLLLLSLPALSAAEAQPPAGEQPQVEEPPPAEEPAAEQPAPPAEAAQPAAEEPAGAQPAGEQPAAAAAPAVEQEGHPRPAPEPEAAAEEQPKVSMDFRGVGIDAILEMFSEVANVTILKDPTVEGTATIICPEEVTLDEAFQLLKSVLDVRGYALLRDKRVVKIVPMQRAVQMTQDVWLPGQDEGRDSSAQVVTELLPLKFADSVQIQNEFRPLLSEGASLIGNAATNSLIITDTASNVKRVVGLIRQIDTETAASITTRVYTVKHADAAQLAEILNQIFSQSSSSSRSGRSGSSSGRPSFGGSRGFPFGGFGGFRGFGGPRGSLEPDPDSPEANQRYGYVSPDGSRSVVLAADVQTTEAPAPVSPAADVDRETGPDVRIAQGPGGRGGSSDFIRRMMELRSRERSGSSGSASTAMNEIKAVADPYSNSIIITAPEDKMEMIDEVLQQLDIELDRDTDVQLFRLRYADATEVAQILTQAIVSTQGGTTGSSRSSVPWERRVSGQSSRYSSSASGAVIATPETRTNSVIVTATPKDMEVAKALIEDLDQPSEAEPTTFTIALDNARASDVSEILNDLLGSTSGTRTTSTSRTGTSQQRSFGNNSSRRSGGFGGSSTFGGGSSFGRSRSAPSSHTGDGTVSDVLANGPQTTAAAAPSATGEPQRLAQFGGFGGSSRFGGYRPRTSSSSSSLSDSTTTAVNAAGEVVTVMPLAQGGRVVPDDETNTLIIDAMPQTADVIRDLVAKLDVAPAQVMVDVTIAEVALDAETKLGIEWSWLDKATAGSSPMSNTLSTNFDLANETTGLKYSVLSDNGAFSTLLHAMASDQRVTILSKPKIFTRNNQPAQINISQSVPYLRGTTITGTGVTQNNYEYIDVGIVLDVTPYISHGDNVTLDVVQTANEIIGMTSFEAPIIATRSADTSVTLKTGQTVVLGGIMKETNTDRLNKVPLLGDIPVLGKLFQSKSEVTGKTELMVFLQPRVVRTPEQIEAVTDEARATNDTAELIEHIDGGAR